MHSGWAAVRNLKIVATADALLFGFRGPFVLLRLSVSYTTSYLVLILPGKSFHSERFQLSGVKAEGK